MFIRKLVEFNEWIIADCKFMLCCDQSRGLLIIIEITKLVKSISWFHDELY